jgi:hypothetical protein
LDDKNPWKGNLSATVFAVRSTFHTALQNAPGQLVFGHDMIVDVKHEANWEYISAWKQNIIKKNNKSENAKRIPHTYTIGDKILLKRGTENKYETPYQGPFTITQVNENGTVQMMIKNVEDTINISTHSRACDRAQKRVSGWLLVRHNRRAQPNAQQRFILHVRAARTTFASSCRSKVHKILIFVKSSCYHYCRKRLY